MAIPITGDFAIEKIKLGNEPVFLVEIQTAGRFFSTREPVFTGKWKAGDGLLAGSGIEANDDYPTYDGGLSQIVDDGISTISMTLDFTSGLALTGNTSVSILNQLLFSHITDDFDLTNAKIRVRLGFFTQTFQDYITIFQGAIAEFEASLMTMELSCIDDTVLNLIPVPPQLGSDFIAQSQTVGQAIPIILGDVDLVPVYPLISDVTGTLLTPMDTLQTEANITEAGARFPRTGEVTIDAEVITYTGVRLTIIGQQQALQLTGLTRGVAAAHAAGTDVTLTSFDYEFLLGFEAQSVRRIRKALGVAPTTAVTPVVRALDPTGNDPRRISVFTTDTEDTDLTATVEGFGRAPNLIVNGEGETDPTTIGWTVGNGAWDTDTNLGELAIRGTVNSAQAVDSELFQDITTVSGDKYRLTASITLLTGSEPPFATIRVGTPADATAVFDFGQITSTSEIGVDLTFNAPGTTTRITLVVNSDTPGAAERAFFDHIVCYKVSSENPAVQIERLIELHAGNQQITVDPVSFAAAEAVYNVDGERLAGVIDQTQEIQAMLGRIAFQYRAKTFLDESGLQKLIPFDNAAPAIAEIDENDVDKGTFTVLFEPEEKVYSRFYVYFNRRADLSTGSGLGGRDAYQNVLFATPDETNSVNDGALRLLCQQARDTFRINRPLEIFADMIPDATTADKLLSHVVRQHTHRRVLARWTTYINNVELEIADVVRITHELLPPSANNVTFEIIDKEIHPNGCQVSFTAAEIRQSQYNIYIETWEPPFAKTPSAIQIEQWPEPPAPQFAIFSESGEELTCNPWIENWEPFTAIRSERFLYQHDTSDIGTAPVELSRSLIAAFDGFFPQGVQDTNSTFARFFVHPSSNAFPESGQFVISTTPGAQSGTPRLVMERAQDYSIGSSFFGIPAPGFASQLPQIVASGGPGGTVDAHSFINNNTDPRFVVQRIRASSMVRWIETDFTANFWIYQSQKGSLHRPFFGNRETSSDADRRFDDRVAWLMWWDFTDDRWHLTLDYFDDEGITDVPVYNTYIANLRAHADHTAHTSLGAPALNTWYMVTMRWDLSALTMDWTINGDFTSLQETITLGGVPTNDSYRAGSQVNFMADFRLQSGLITETEDDSFGMNGRLAQMHFWSRRLTDSELTDLYNSGDSLPFPYV